MVAETDADGQGILHNYATHYHQQLIYILFFLVWCPKRDYIHVSTTGITNCRLIPLMGSWSCNAECNAEMGNAVKERIQNGNIIRTVHDLGPIS